jgi:hypothetical protein
MCFSYAFAQGDSFGFQLGGAQYFGDLDAPNFRDNVKRTSLAGGFLFRHSLSESFALRANFFTGTLKGDDNYSDLEWQQLRNLSFKSKISEIALITELNVLKIINKSSTSSFRPYLAVGFAYFHFNPLTFFEGRWYELQPLGTEGQGMEEYPERYKLNQFSIPFGGGIEYRISSNFSIGVEILSRKTFTDHIDDVSGNYVNYFELRSANGEMAANLANRQGEVLGQSEPVILPTGTVRGKSDVKDYYLTSMISIVYHLNAFGSKSGKSNKIACPNFN